MSAPQFHKHDAMFNFAKKSDDSIKDVKNLISKEIDEQIEKTSRLGLNNDAKKILRDGDKKSLRNIHQVLVVLVVLNYLVLFSTLPISMISSSYATFMKWVFLINSAAMVAAIFSHISVKMGNIGWYSKIRSFIKLRKSSWTTNDALNALELGMWDHPSLPLFFDNPAQYRPLNEHELLNINTQVAIWNSASCAAAWKTMLKRKGMPIRQQDIDHLMKIKCYSDQLHAIEEAEKFTKKALTIFEEHEQRTKPKKSISVQSETIEKDPQQDFRIHILHAGAPNVPENTLMLDETLVQQPAKNTTSHTQL